MIYALLLVILLTGCNSVEKIPSVKERYAGKTIYVYIFDDKTQLWNRATVETLMKADCNKIHLLASPEE